MTQNWYCPDCGSTYKSPIPVEKVMHRCVRGKRKRMILATETAEEATGDNRSDS